jgi:hypothetical protein
MEALFASGLIADLALLLLAAEAALLWLLRRLTGRGPRFADIAWFLLAGGALLVALRVALSGGWWGWIGVALLAALAAHGVDLRRRWHGGDRAPGPR